MGRIRLKIREFASEKRWTLREVANRTGIPYSTVTNYASAPSLSTVDYTALLRLSRAFEIPIEELVEVLEE
ncbi:helix-turn-helix domain-containing protein [Thermoleptolyngbya sp.]